MLQLAPNWRSPIQNIMLVLCYLNKLWQWPESSRLEITWWTLCWKLKERQKFMEFMSSIVKEFTPICLKRSKHWWYSGDFHLVEMFECSLPWSNSVNYLVNCEACCLEFAANIFKNCSNICTLCSNVVTCRCKLDRRTLQKHKFSRCKTSRPSLSPDIIEYLMTKFSFLLMGSGKSQVISL